MARELIINGNQTNSLTHSTLRMPQGSPGQGRGMPPGSISRGFDMIQGILSIGNVLVFTIIFDVYDAYGAEVSDHMSLLYSFSLNAISEVDEMYEN